MGDQRLPIPAVLWAAAADGAREHGAISHRQDTAPGARQAETHGGIGYASCPASNRAAAGIFGTGRALWGRADVSFGKSAQRETGLRAEMRSKYARFERLN